jgi:tRNA threonylcarbamoyladenosine biosynthesis protein TsaB
MSAAPPEAWILAVETSTDWPSIALLTPDGLHGEYVWPAHQNLAERLVLQVDAMLRHAGLSPSDLHLIAVSRGPGSFTGTRIGVVTAKGWAQALGCPLLGVSALDALAEGTPCQGFRTCVALIPAPKRGVYVGWYAVEGSSLRRTEPFQILSPNQLLAKLRTCPTPGLLTGGASRPVATWLDALGPSWTWAGPAFALPRASLIGQGAWRRWQEGQRDDLHTLAPLYLRPTEAERGRGTVVYPPRP